MTLNQAIKHCDDVIHKCQNPECIADHYQLRLWLSELKNLKDENRI